MLKLNRLDTIIMYEKTANLMLKKANLTTKIKPAFLCLESPVYVIFSRKHPKAQLYADKLDEGLQKIHADGTFDRLKNNY